MNKPGICFLSMSVYHLLADSSESRFCGGAELQQYLIGQELAARGYPVTFVTRDYGQGPDRRIEPFRVLGAYRPEAGLPILKYYHPRWSGIMKALLRADAEIYYLRGADFLLAPMVMAARRAGKRVLFAGASDSDFNSKSDHFQYLRDKLLYWWALRRVDAVVAQNKHQAAGAKEQLGLEAQIIHNALPNHPDTLGSPDNVLWVGNIRPKKSPERFVDLAEAFPEHRFVMVGGFKGRTAYPVGVTTSMGREATGLPNFEHTGYLQPSEVEHHYAKARVLINTSDVEGFPNTFLHAWAWGVPVLTFVDPDSIVKKNELGWVVSSPEEMKRVLAGILSGELRRSPERIAEYFRSECMTSRQVDHYESVFKKLTVS